MMSMPLRRASWARSAPGVALSLKPLVLPPAQPRPLPSGEPSGDTLVRRAPSSRPHPHLNVPAPWPQVRADLRLWIVLGDLAAVLVPVWALLLLGRTDTALAVGVAGGGQVALVWSMGGLGPGSVDHGRVPSGRLALCALLTCPVSLLAAQTLGAPRRACLLLLALQALLVLAGRVLEGSWLYRRRLEGHALRRTLVVMGPGAEPMMYQLRRFPGDGLMVVGYLSSGVGDSYDRPADPVRSAQHVASLVADERIDVVMTVGSVTPGDLLNIMRGLEGTPVRLLVAPGLQDVEPERMEGVPVTHGWTGVVAVRTRRTRALGKAVFDRVAGTLLTVLAAPVIGLAALAVRLDSPGPAFYRQVRVGRGGEPFTLWKLRSMYVDADARRAALVSVGGDAGNEVLFKDRADPRITRVGHWIRRLSIDELPQLINVVTGEMSLVGPRPALPEEVAAYETEARRRLLVKPGLTGLWQVSGRSDLSWESTVALDRHYVENQGGGMDVRILARTVQAVLGGRGAY